MNKKQLKETIVKLETELFNYNNKIDSLRIDLRYINKNNTELTEKAVELRKELTKALTKVLKKEEEVKSLQASLYDTDNIHQSSIAYKEVRISNLTKANRELKEQKVKIVKEKKNIINNLNNKNAKKNVEIYNLTKELNVLKNSDKIVRDSFDGERAKLKEEIENLKDATKTLFAEKEKIKQENDSLKEVNKKISNFQIVESQLEPVLGELIPEDRTTINIDKININLSGK